MTHVQRLLLTAGVGALTALAASAQTFSLSLFHNNDGESKFDPLTGMNAGYGGASYFTSLLQSERAAAQAAGREVVTVSSGDNFLAGANYAASIADGVSYDGLVLAEIGYDAITLGNHDFDFGPDDLATIIAAVPGVPFISANLDVSADPNVGAGSAVAGRIVGSTVVSRGGKQIAIVGATTPQLPTISSPGNNIVINPVVTAAQAEIDALRSPLRPGGPVDIVIFSSHLQSVSEDLAIIPQLSGVDVAIAGGGDDLLLNSTAPHPAGSTIPADANRAPSNGYPITSVLNLDGDTVPVVTTTGEYRYVGRIDIDFDAATNEIVAFSTDLTNGASPDPLGPLPVAHAGRDLTPGTGDDIVPNTSIETNVIAPVTVFKAGLAANTISSNASNLDGRTSQVRSRETNLGNLLIDAMIWQAEESASSVGATVGGPSNPVVGFTNGGGIRNNSVIAGPGFTELNTFDVAPFANFVGFLDDATAQQLKDMLENAVGLLGYSDGSATPVGTTGKFAQVGGFSFTYDLRLTATTYDAASNPVVLGNRVTDIVLDDGTVILEDGVFTADAALLSFDIVTTDFLGRDRGAGFGGDGYPVAGLNFTSVGETYQQALLNYIEAAEVMGGLDGDLSGYAGPEGRITVTPEPGAATVLLGLGALGWVVSRRRRTA